MATSHSPRAFLAAALLAGAGTAPLGAQLVSEPFDYPDGDLTSQIAWSAHNASGNGPIQVSSGAAVVSHANSEDVNTDFTDQASGSVYYAIDFSVADLGAPYSGSDEEYFAHFRGSGGTSGFIARMFIDAPASTGDFSVAVSTSSSDPAANWATDLDFNTVYRAVVRYDISANQTTLWIDASVEGDTSVQTGSGGSGATIEDFALRQSSSSEDETITIDNLKVGTAFDDVVDSTIAPTLGVALTPNTIAEDAAPGSVSVTVTRSGDTSAPLDVILSSSNLDAATIATTAVQIPIGQLSETFAVVDPTDDTAPDGDNLTTISASASGFNSGGALLTVTDDGDPVLVVINEIHADPDNSLAGDANGDGVRDGSEDEFLEIVNVSGGPLDLTDWTIFEGSSDVSPRHTFPLGTILEDGCAVVVFGGGSLAQLGGGAYFQVSSESDLGLNNSNETVEIRDSLGQIQANVSYGNAGNNESINLDPDLTGTSYADHSSITGAVGLSSPGTEVDGTEFCPAIGSLSIGFDAPSMSESGGSITATITRTTSDNSQALEVSLLLDDESEASLPGPTALILANENSVEVTITAVDDALSDGTQTVTLFAGASRHDATSNTFDVNDDGDVSPEVVINEIMYDPTPADTNGDGAADGSDDEFIEIVNTGANPEDISGWTISDLVAVRHTFPPGTILAPGQAIVVFGGGTLASFSDFSPALVQLASTGFLGFNNTGDSAFLMDGASVIDSVDFGSDPAPGGQSITRDPDLTGSFVAHGSATGSTTDFSPGTRIDGTDFAGGSAAPALSLAITEVDTVGGTVTFELSGLADGTLYSLLNSTDLDFSAAPSIADFSVNPDFTTVGTITGLGGGVYELEVSDDVGTDRQFYAVEE